MNRESLIHKSWESDLYKYITGILQNQGHKMLQINGMPDHTHIFFGLRPTQSLSELMKILKGDSSKWINAHGFLKHRFSWQAGFGAFSYSKSDVSRLIEYVRKQKEHHRTKTFKQEYIKLLRSNDIIYDEKFIFTSIE